MAKKTKKRKPHRRVRNSLIQIDPMTYLVGGPEEEPEKPIIIAWLSSPSVGDEIATEGVYKQLYEEIFEPDPERSKVITLHLYVEYWLDMILEKLSIPPPDTFKKKIDTLNSKGTFEKTLYDNLVAINRLRNIYAHELDLAKAHEKVSSLISQMALDPYFVCTDQDHFRIICIQTMFLLESTFKNDGKPPKFIFPKDAIREKLKTEGKLHWQDCELLSKKQVSQYVHRLTLRCPYCQSGTIIREKDETPGFRESDMTCCEKCDLTGDGSYLDFKTIKAL